MPDHTRAQQLPLVTELAFARIVDQAPKWPTDANFDVVSPTPETMAAWLFYARMAAPRLRAGDVNWPGMVRSAVARIEALEAMLKERSDG